MPLKMARLCMNFVQFSTENQILQVSPEGAAFNSPVQDTGTKDSIIIKP